MRRTRKDHGIRDAHGQRTVTLNTRIEREAQLRLVLPIYIQDARNIYTGSTSTPSSHPKSPVVVCLRGHWYESSWLTVRQLQRYSFALGWSTISSKRTTTRMKMFPTPSTGITSNSNPLLSVGTIDPTLVIIGLAPATSVLGELLYSTIGFHNSPNVSPASERFITEGGTFLRGAVPPFANASTNIWIHFDGDLVVGPEPEEPVISDCIGGISPCHSIEP